jgi:hypothetical protein
MSTKETELETKEESTSGCSGEKLEKAQKEVAAKREKAVQFKELQEKQHNAGGCGSGCG